MTTRPDPRHSAGQIDLCVECAERPIDHPATSECHRCLQRRWRQTNSHHNVRSGKRAEQKRAWDKAAAKRKKEARDAP